LNSLFAHRFRSTAMGCVRTDTADVIWRWQGGSTVNTDVREGLLQAGVIASDHRLSRPPQDLDVLKVR
jgi:hypothetical protein